MAVSTPESLLKILKKSEILSEERFAEVQRAAKKVDNAKTLAKHLVRNKWLTSWQAGQLLAGRSAFLLGKYRLIDLLGSGGMGRVFLAEHTTMSRRVAVKIISKKLAEDPASLEQFIQEARAVAALDHPNIVQAYDVDSEGSRYYLVMEFVVGQDLQKEVAESEPLPFEKAVDYIRQAAAGLAHAHGREMIHCDIKPANLLVNQQGVVKILDMGMARLAGRVRTEAPADDDRPLGTVDYLAPEQAVESPNFDHRADIYALGCTFYFLLTGQPPFPEGTIHERILKHQTAQPGNIGDLRSDTPGDLIEICRKMMAKEPDDRYGAAEEVVEVLAEWKPAKKKLKRAVALAGDDSPSEEAPGAVGPFDINVESSSSKKSAPAEPDEVVEMAEPADEPDEDATPAKASGGGIFSRHPKRFLFGGIGTAAALALAAVLGMMFFGGSDPDADTSRAAASEEDQKADGEGAGEDSPEEEMDIEELDDLASADDDDLLAGISAGLRGSDDDTPKPKASPAETGDSGQDATMPEPDEPKPAAAGDAASAKPATKEATPEEPASGAKPAEKTPEKTPATTPEKTPEKKPEKPKPKPKPVDPLRSVAEAVDIPELSTRPKSGEKSPGPVALATIHTAPDSDWQIYLLGGDTALKRNRQFVLEPVERDPAKASWSIQLESAATGKDPARSDIAKLWRDAKDLKFQWAEGAAASTANYLRNCVLQLRVEGKSKYVNLTTPQPAMPLDVDLSRGTASVSIPVKWAPDASNLRVEIVHVEGRKGHATEPAEPASTAEPFELFFIRKDSAGNTNKMVAFRVNFKARATGIQAKLDLAQPPVMFFRPFAENGVIARNTLEVIRDGVRKELNPKNKDDAPKGEKRSALLARIDQADAQMWYIDFYNEVHAKAKVHYRVFTQAADRKVILAYTDPTLLAPPKTDQAKKD